MNFKNKYALMLLLFLGTMATVAAQGDEVDHSYKPLTLKLDESGSKYVRFIMWHQIWATTNNFSSSNSEFAIDPSIRRSRFLAFAQISPKFLILTHWGLNNLGTSGLNALGNQGDGPQLFLHDAWAEFKVTDQLYIGGGLHYWKGMTRLSNQSTLNMMTMDNPRPFVHWHSLGLTDQFARHLGIYAKGTIGKFQYRMALNQPMVSSAALRGGFSYAPSTVAYTGGFTRTADGEITGKTIAEGYFEYQFFDTESDKLPYKVGTYFGKKKIFNLGVGFFAHPNGAYDTLSTEHVNVQHFAADAFLELPTSSGALNAYVSYMNFDYGNNFVGRWAGTGNNIYAHLGYYLKAANIMPYVAFQQGSYDGYADPVVSFDAGVNYYVNGHFAKLTLEYHSIQNQLSDGASDVSQLRLQAHIFL